MARRLQKDAWAPAFGSLGIPFRAPKGLLLKAGSSKTIPTTSKTQKSSINLQFAANFAPRNTGPTVPHPIAFHAHPHYCNSVFGSHWQGSVMWLRCKHYHHLPERQAVNHYIGKSPLKRPNEFIAGSQFELHLINERFLLSTDKRTASRWDRP